MKYILILGFILFMAVYGCGEQKQAQTTSDSKAEMMQHNNEQSSIIYYYTCPMDEHKHVHSDKPGKCPKCSMKLVAATQATAEDFDYYGCPMETHSFMRHDKTDTCEECGMQLEPMKLKSN